MDHTIHYVLFVYFYLRGLLDYEQEIKGFNEGYNDEAESEYVLYWGGDEKVRAKNSGITWAEDV